MTISDMRKLRPSRSDLVLRSYQWYMAAPDVLPLRLENMHRDLQRSLQMYSLSLLNQYRLLFRIENYPP